MTPNVVLGCESHPSTALCRRGRPRWLTITLSQSNLFQTKSPFTYSLFIDCSPVQKNDHRQWLGDGTRSPMCANDGEILYSHLCATWRRASSFPGSLPRHHWIPGLLYLFPSGATRATSTCQKKRKPISSPHSSTLTAYAKFISPWRLAIHFGHQSATNRSLN